MRFVAVFLLVSSSLSALGASADRIHETNLARPISHRSPELTMASPGLPSPVAPSRRDVAIEPALEEEESNDLDPLDTPLGGFAARSLARPAHEATAIHSPLPSSTRQGRPGLLRC